MQKSLFFLTILFTILLSACTSNINSNPVPPSLSITAKESSLYQTSIKPKEPISAEKAYQKGVDYTTGKNNTEPNLIQAVNWIKYAAGQGYAEAQLKLGLMYLQGIGVDVNKKNAFLSMLIAAQSGNYQAQRYLGYFYQQGIGTEKNFILSEYWLDQAKTNHQQTKN